MADFRSRLYAKYTSRFKGEWAEEDDRKKRSYYEDCRVRYQPLLEGMDRDEPILDLGCGQGRLMQFIHDSGFTDVSGVDISAEQVRIAREKGFRVKVAEAREFLRSSKRKYKIIFAMSLFEHFTRDELLTLITRLYDSLKSGGMLVLETPNGQGLFSDWAVYGDLTHMTVFTPSSLRQLLEFGGFTDVRTYEKRPVPIGSKGRVKARLWRMVRWGAMTIQRIEGTTTQDIWTAIIFATARRP